MQKLLSPAEYVIGVFGGLTGTAAAIGAPVTTVQGWKERGRIPQSHWQKIIGAADTKKRELKLEDFVHDHLVEAA